MPACHIPGRDHPLVTQDWPSSVTLADVSQSMLKCYPLLTGQTGTSEGQEQVADGWPISNPYGFERACDLAAQTV